MCSRAGRLCSLSFENIYLFKAVPKESKKRTNYAEHYRGRDKIKVTKAEKGSREVGGSLQMPTTLQPSNTMFHLLIFIPSLHFRGWSLGFNLLSVHIARLFFFLLILRVQQAVPKMFLPRAPVYAKPAALIGAGSTRHWHFIHQQRSKLHLFFFCSSIFSLYTKSWKMAFTHTHTHTTINLLAQLFQLL